MLHQQTVTYLSQDIEWDKMLALINEHKYIHIHTILLLKVATMLFYIYLVFFD